MVQEKYGVQLTVEERAGRIASIKTLPTPNGCLN